MPSRLLLSLAVVACCVAHASADDRVSTNAPVPTWVDSVTVPTPTQGSDRGVDVLLFDRQVRLVPSGTERFFRRVFRYASASGIQDSSEIEIPIASTETLALHFVRRWRDGVAEELLPHLAVRVLTPESRRAEGILDDGRSAVVVLEDIRVGDTIEYAYTVTADDSVLGGKHAGDAVLASMEPVRLFRFRLAWTPDVHVRVRTDELATTWSRRDTSSTLTLEARDLAAYESVPFREIPSIEWSSFADLGEVVAWASPHYASPGTLPASLAPLVERIAREPDVARRAREAVHVVQDEVRYLGLEAGERSVFPHPPELVYARRFGDCKDKTLLLVTVLRALGIEASPAFVSSDAGEHLSNHLPSPTRFDHVVVVASIEGRSIWIDSTRTFERGPIADTPSLPFHVALPIRVGSAAFVTIPATAPPEPTTSVLEEYTIDDSGGARLFVHTEYRGADANRERATAGRVSAKDRADGFRDFYGRQFHGIEAEHPPTFSDDEASNVIRIEESYRIPTFWVDGERDVRAWLLDQYLPDVQEDRGQPISLIHPLFVRHDVRVRTTESWHDDEDEATVESAAIRFEGGRSIDGSTYRFGGTLRTLRDRVEASATEAFGRDVERIQDLSGRNLLEDVPASVRREEDAELVFGILGILVAFLVVVVAFGRLREFVAKRRARAFQRKQRFGRGEGPDTALDVTSLDEARTRLSTVRCCRRPKPSEPQWSELRYDGDRIVASARRCAECEQVERRYFRLPKAS